MLTYKEIYTVAKIIYSVLFKSFPYLETLVKYFKNMNKILTKLGLGVIWLTPAGMIITQKYVDTISIEIISSMFGNRNSVTLSKPILDKINLRKQNTGIVPNIVHSLDATNVAILIKNIKYKHKNLDVLTIHDCFATQANDVEVMKIQIKLAFLTIYGDKKFLNRYNRFILSYIQNNGFSIYKNKIVETNDVLPVVSKFETNENLINNVLNSQYFVDYSSIQSPPQKKAASSNFNSKL